MTSLQQQLQELNQEMLDSKVDAATTAREQAAVELQAAEHGVEAATRELAGASAQVSGTQCLTLSISRSICLPHDAAPSALVATVTRGAP